MNNSPAIRDRDVYASLGLLLVVAFGFFYFAGSYILYFQETQSLFLFTREYLFQHFSKPGAPLEYAAKFLTQFYTLKFAGSLILSLTITLPAILMLRINKKMVGKPLSLTTLLIPSLILLMLQANYYHMMEYNLGILMVLSYYLVLISKGERYRHVLVLILFPLYYLLTGAYVQIFVLMYIFHNLVFEKGRRRFIYSLLLLSVATATYFIFLKIVFLQPFQQLLLFPLPLLESTSYTVTFIILVILIVFYPLICKGISLLNLQMKKNRIYDLVPVAFAFIVTIFFLVKAYNPQTARVIGLQRLAFAGKWNEAVSFQEKYPSKNLIGQYFYNVALSETGQLCDRLFFGGQDFGTNSLILPWGDEHLNRGAYFYYSVGLINEAHRWAYEEMVVYGYRPQNIQILVKTNLINGNYSMAVKYINILKSTLFYRKWAEDYEKLTGNPDLIISHPDLGAKLKILPRDNFFIQFTEPQNNLPLLLGSRPDNRKAFEYYISWLLLARDVEGAVNNIKGLKDMGYNQIPRHLEEAVWIYYNSKGTYPDLGGLTLSDDSRSRFQKYFTAYVSMRQNPEQLKQKMQKDFRNTFWYYFHFK
ncbi:MAG: DUF6057 family protein [Bacteroidales bacterium]